MSQGDDATHNRPAHPFMLFRKPFQRLAVGRNLARRLAAGNCPGMRRTHHNAFKNGLAADEGLLAALQRRQKLDSYKDPPQCPQKSHTDWMIFQATKYQM